MDDFYACSLASCFYWVRAWKNGGSFRPWLDPKCPSCPFRYSSCSSPWQRLSRYTRFAWFASTSSSSACLKLARMEGFNTRKFAYFVRIRARNYWLPACSAFDKLRSPSCFPACLWGSIHQGSFSVFVARSKPIAGFGALSTLRKKEHCC